jgi:hypothetical protein
LICINRRNRKGAPLPPAFAPSFSLRFIKISPTKQPIVGDVYFVFTFRSNPMNSDTSDLDETDETLIANDLSDEALEAAANGHGQGAITWAYCSNYWTCWPLRVGEPRASSRVDRLPHLQA